MSTVSRRAVLAGAMGVLAAGCRPGEGETPPPAVVGAAHQDGIVTPPPDAAVFAAFDLTVQGRDGLAAVLRRLGDRASPSEGASVTIAVGASLFDQRFGLESLRPRHLTAMPPFRGDVLDPAACHGDLLVQVCAPTVEKAAEALRAATDGLEVKPRWRIDGFRPENRADGPGGARTTRNLFGFREGAGNPDVRDTAMMDRLVWTNPASGEPASGEPASGEPAWTAGGSYQVIRLIRMALPLWAADSIAEQEAVFGRRKAGGAVLGRERETDEPDYSSDPEGRTVPLDAHIRLANPRTPATDASRILRRGYSFDRGTDAAGQPDAGLIFVCFQQDLERGFATVQRRLAGEALQKYLLAFGGGYFFALPGGGEFPGSGLVGGV